jgi:hypothetical protein
MPAPPAPPAPLAQVINQPEQLLLGAQPVVIRVLPGPDDLNAITQDEFVRGENIIIIRENGRDYMFKRDPLLAYFRGVLNQAGNPILKNPLTNNDLFRKGDPFPLGNPPVFLNGITFKTGTIAADAEPAGAAGAAGAAAVGMAGGKRRQSRKRRSRRKSTKRNRKH